MAFTGQLGTVNSYLDNIELGAGAGITPHNIYSGLYQLKSGKRHDTLYSLISYPEFQTVDLKIPDPYMESSYQTDSQENIIHIGAIKARVVGNGNLVPTLYSLDKIRQYTTAFIVLSPTSIKEYQVLANFFSQRVMLRLETNNKDDYIEVNRIIIYGKPIYKSLPNT